MTNRATGTCAECGATFGYRPRGIPAISCSDACRHTRQARQGRDRGTRWRSLRSAALDTDSRPTGSEAL